MKKFFEKIVEGGLLISGSVSSFTILLIVFFLFKEAGGLFNTPATEEGYVLAVNEKNDVTKLSPEKIMDIFDALNDTGSTIIMITHEQEIAERAKRINYIRDGILSDGRRDGESLA